jgi:adenylate cyclase class IV
VGPLELELKGIVPDPAATRAALIYAGATPGFRGMLFDRRFDREGEFTRRDQVVRLRTYRSIDGSVRSQLGWKGPTTRSAEGYKQREERELEVGEGDPASFLAALGLVEVHAIDRYIEMYALAEGHARLEWYPRMDVLMEVEGAPTAIEAIIAATGIARSEFTSDALTAFTARYDLRHPEAPSLVSQPGWEGPSL